ncbi:MULTISPECIES: hypothetical protein [Bacillus amyloliquefaciens group]|uniref:hypothetical protein n=1 Tax=Bacillus amyloliquefaciens group TaxID=1938374 RepID=UPI0003967EDD|nr:MULTISPECIES: hypothetical protein [Bacillus amyloliquefaciens group]ERH54773.1 hypothetical protein O205_10110 [Bacillus amyloliquefaciens EGD-AQ14]WRT07031.1 hypothetical protein VO177_05695 [Bacillus velezensis]
MRLGSWMYGACAQIAVTVFTVCGLVLALPVVSLFIMVLNGMQDAIFVVFSILLLLLFYALGWIWAVSFAREWKVKLFELQISSLIPLAGILYLYIDSGVSIPELIHDWHEDGCALVPPAFVCLCTCYAMVLVPVYQSKLWNAMEAGRLNAKAVCTVWGDLLIILVLLAGTTWICF